MLYTREQKVIVVIIACDCFGVFFFAIEELKYTFHRSSLLAQVFTLIV